MVKDIRNYLNHIIQSISEIEEFLELKSRRFDVYLNDTMFRRAIERNISIIGEAMTNILKINPNIEISEAKNIKGCRNYVIHAYDSLDPTIIWAAVIKDIPVLKLEVIKVLEEINSNESSNR